jgi:hypothetical protein
MADKVLTIRCRAKVSASCYHDRPETGVYPDGADDDGTWRESDGTVVCDPCYIALGQPRRDELEAAVAAAQGGSRA